MISDRQIRRVTEERIVIIDEVNTTNGHISMTDQYGTTLYASLDFMQPVVVVPQIGETWVAERRNTSWYLKRKQQRASDMATLNPGDVLIQATGTLRIQFGEDTFEFRPDGTIHGPTGGSITWDL